MSFDALKIGLVSVSDRASAGVYQDQGIPSLKAWLQNALLNPTRSSEWWMMGTRMPAMWNALRSISRSVFATLRSDTSSSQQHPAGVPGAPPGGATTPSSAAKSTDLTTATWSMRRQQRGKAKTHLGGQCCTGPPRRGIARAHLGDGGHDADEVRLHRA